MGEMVAAELKVQCTLPSASHMGPWAQAPPMQAPTPAPGSRTVFFDLDSTLYPKSLGIHNQMADRIQRYMEDRLKLPVEESRRLGAKYYLDYGLAIRGITKDFQICVDDYDRFVDGGLELSGLLRPDNALRDWLASIKGARWIFTNAGIQHAERVLGMLGIRDMFLGIIYCDYAEPGFPAKPERLAYERAMKCAAVSSPEHCYFIDDSANNVRVAAELGWKAVLYDEEDDYAGLQSTFPRVRELYQLTDAYPELLEDPPHSNGTGECMRTANLGSLAGSCCSV